MTMTQSRSTMTMLFYQLVLQTIVSSSVVAAFSNVHYHGCNGPKTISNNHLQNREYFHASKTVRRSTSSDDATITSPPPATRLSNDIKHMNLATSLARIGYGNTFPNPAVGCVLVRQNDDDDSSLGSIIGSGFHPKAGMPHAEVFALLEACGHVEDGVAAARSVMGATEDGTDDTSLNNKVLELLTTYKSEDGASELFNDHFVDCNVTAYVTLEPCCHVGQTPPCALSLVAAGVTRVVVGYRDPNPRVDGGGIQLLQDAGIGVQVLRLSNSARQLKYNEEAKAAAECSYLVKYFVKRISPRGEEHLEDAISGKNRMVLRTIAGRQKTEGTIHQVEWPKDKSLLKKDKEESDFAENVPLDNRLLERIDQSLWDHEIVLLRLNKAVKKKKGAKILGGRVAEALNAHVAQVIGHTALLYRPAFPPVLDLDELAKKDADDSNSD
mmetsp:Transcript_3560/g.7861  ORF Transcript_3560/g.7861 Transcript_3560/m.7861 type:complete len:440 (-) Transcript_3560:31-1350(-)